MDRAFTYREVHDILKMLKESEHCESINIEIGNTKIHLVRSGGGEARVAAAAQANSVPIKPTIDRSSADATTDGNFVRAPMLGIFFRAKSPEALPFVEVGTRVKADDTVCLIEVMKLFSAVQAGINGVVEEVLAENGALVEHNQPLFRIKPD